VSPVFRHSSHPVGVRGETSRIESRWVQRAIGPCYDARAVASKPLPSKKGCLGLFAGGSRDFIGGHLVGLRVRLLQVWLSDDGHREERRVR